MSTPTITPTVTPAPKPEWPELTAWIVCRSGSYIVLTALGEPNGSELATVTIPSSAECERRAKVEEAKERVLFAAEQLVRSGWKEAKTKLIQEVEALWKIEQENQP